MTCPRCGLARPEKFGFGWRCGCCGQILFHEKIVGMAELARRIINPRYLHSERVDVTVQGKSFPLLTQPKEIKAAYALLHAAPSTYPPVEAPADQTSVWPYWWWF